jgi:hypothetical protein
MHAGLRTEESQGAEIGTLYKVKAYQHLADGDLAAFAESLDRALAMFAVRACVADSCDRGGLAHQSLGRTDGSRSGRTI